MRQLKPFPPPQLYHDDYQNRLEANVEKGVKSFDIYPNLSDIVEGEIIVLGNQTKAIKLADGLYADKIINNEIVLTKIESF